MQLYLLTTIQIKYRSSVLLMPTTAGLASTCQLYDKKFAQQTNLKHQKTVNIATH